MRKMSMRKMSMRKMSMITMPSSKKRKCDKTSPLFSVNSHGPPSSHGLSSFPSEILGEIFSFGGIKIFKAFARK